MTARVWLCLPLLAMGCSSYATVTPKIPPVDVHAAVHEGAAQICVVHVHSPGTTARPTQVVRDNGHLVGATVGDGYFCYVVRPGAHRVTSEVGFFTEALDLVLGPGERRFVRHAFRAHKGVSLELMPEDEARADIADLKFQALAEAPEPIPSPAAAVAAASGPEAAPTPKRTQDRASGLVYGVAAGLGFAATRASSKANTSGGFAALGSGWMGLAAGEAAVLALRVDGAYLNGNAVADLALHMAVSPGAGRVGPARDLVVFGDGGIRIPTGQGTASGAMGLGRLGVAWEHWAVGPGVVGPFVGGQFARGGGAGDAAVVVGVTGSIYPSEPHR